MATWQTLFIILVGCNLTTATDCSSADTSDIQMSITTLQTRIIDLTKELWNVDIAGFKNSLQNISKEVETITISITNSNMEEQSKKQLGMVVSLLSKQVRRIEKTLEKKLTPEECVRAILSGKFKEADRILREIGSNSNVTNLIINKVYHQAGDNFHLIAGFVKRQTHIGRALDVLNAFKHELEADGSINDPIKTIKLAILYKYEVYFQINVLPTQKDISSRKMDLLEQLLRNNSYEPIKKNLLTGSLDPSTRILINEIHGYLNDDLKRILELIIQDFDTRTDYWMVLKTIRSFSYIEEAISGLRVLFKKLNGTNREELLGIAYELKRITLLDNYEGVHSVRRGDMQALKESLPLSVRNIVFNDTVRIQNQKWLRDLDIGDNRDTDRRNVTTSSNTKKNWKFELVEDFNNKYHIQNKEHGEYLYASMEQSNGQRDVFTWKNRNDRPRNGVFRVLLSGDDVYLLNTFYDEYLLAATGGDRKRVSTLGRSTMKEEMVWKVIA